MDARRRQYVPLSVKFAIGATGTKISTRFGAEGLGVWSALLAAAKRSRVQGTFEWLDDNDAWRQLGLAHCPPAFSFQEFATFLGRMKQARTDRIGQLRVTTLQAWSEWNAEVKRGSDASQKRRKRTENTGDDAPTLRGTEVESEVEPPLPPSGSPRQNGKSPRQRGTNPRAQQPANELVPCTAGCQRWTGTTDDLTEHLATVHALDRPAATVPDDDDLFA